VNRPDQRREPTFPPRPFDPITDCPRCKTVTAHLFERREADPNVEWVEVRRLCDPEPTYIPTGPTEPYTRRECLTCGCTWHEDLPKEWKS
jgi:hypothetical protein